MDSYADPVATLGDRLTAAREAAGLEVGSLAKALGLRPETLAGWEADQAEPSASLMGRIATLTGVSPLWLLTGQGPGPKDAGAEDVLRAELADLGRVLREAAARIARLEEALFHG